MTLTIIITLSLSYYLPIPTLVCRYYVKICIHLLTGIMVTAKKRQEFRIKLQKRARKIADKKMEAIEEEKQYKEVLQLVH